MEERMYRLTILVWLLAAMPLWAQDPMQKLNLGDAAGSRFTVTDRVWPTTHGQADVCLYENDALAAVCVTIDDDYAADHAWWIRTLARYDWKATWFVIVAYVHDGSSAFHGTWQTFQRLDSLGHSIQSHTWSHGHCNDPFSAYATLGCSAILTGGNCCDPDFEYAESQRLIRENIPGNQCWTMAYSGHQVTDRTATVAGTTFVYDSYAHDYAMAAKYYIACRGTVGRPNMPNKTKYLNTSSGPLTGEWLNNMMVKNPAEAAYYRGWVAHLWHAKGDTNANTAIFDTMQQYESAGDLWVPVYENIVRYCQSRDTKTLTVNSVASDLITFTLTDSMLDSVYTYPLTVKVRVNNDWAGVMATQNGTGIPASLISHNSNQYALVKAVPDQGEIALTRVGGTGLAPMNIQQGNAIKKGAVVTLYSVSGRLFRYGTISAQGFVPTEFMGNLPAGIYLYKAEGADRLEKRLIVR
jgi:hypothetical protein